MRLTALAACLLVGGFFIRAAFPKVAHPEDFAFIVYSYRVLPDLWVNAVAHFLPWLELVCGAALILLPGWRAAAGLLISGMLVMFAALLASAITRGIEISCGCLSVDVQADPIGWGSVARNGTLLVLAGLAVWAHAGRRGRAARITAPGPSLPPSGD